MKIDELVQGTEGQDFLLVRIGNQAVLVPLSAEDPIVNPEQIDAYNVDTLEQQRMLVVLICARVTAALISDDDRAKLESLAGAALEGTSIEKLAAAKEG